MVSTAFISTRARSNSRAPAAPCTLARKPLTGPRRLPALPTADVLTSSPNNTCKARVATAAELLDHLEKNCSK